MAKSSFGTLRARMKETNEFKEQAKKEDLKYHQFMRKLLDCYYKSLEEEKKDG